MKRLFLFLFLLFAGGQVFAQENLKMRVSGEIKYVPESVDAKIIAPSRKDKNLLDANGNPPCILKFKFSKEMKGTVYLDTYVIERLGREEHNGDVWFYVASGAQNVTLSCKGYEDLRISLPYKTKSGSEFSILIDPDAAKNQIVLDEYVQEGNYISFKFVPKDVTLKLYSGSELKDSKIITDGSFSSDYLPYGKYSVEVSNALYETFVDTFDFTDKISREIRLSPAYNRIVMNVTPRGAKAFVDNEEWSSQKFYKKGSHMIHLEAPNYASDDFDFYCSGDGTECIVSRDLVARFGGVIITCEDPLAEIWIDKEYKGTGKWSGNLSSLSKHLAEARRQSHHPSSIELIIENNTEKSFTLPKPYPLYGGVKITSGTGECDIYIDGQALGQKTPYLAKLLIGNHKVTLRRPGYLAKDITVNIEENKTISISENLVKGIVKVDATVEFPEGTTLYVDDKLLSSKSPWRGKIDEGPHIFSAHKNNCYPSTSKVTLVPGSSSNKVTLGNPTPKFGNINITSNASGSVHLDGKIIGNTPLKCKVEVGSHDVYVSANRYFDSPNTSFSLSEGETFSKDFRLKKYHKTPWLFRELDSAPNIVEFNYGFDDNINSFLGLTYSFNKRHLGAFASGSFSPSASEWYVAAGPTLNMGIFQLYGGFGGLKTQNVWEKMYTAGARFQTYLGDRYNPVSFSAGVAFNKYKVIPTFGMNVATLPYAFYSYASVDSDCDFGSWFFGADMGVGNDEFFYGLFGEFCPCGGMLGVYTDYLHGTSGSNAFAVGPTFRLIPDYFDMQLYGGIGVCNGDFLKDAGLRFAFASGTDVSLWDFSLGVKWTDRITIFNFSIGSILSAITVSAAALIVATAWVINSAVEAGAYTDYTNPYYYY